MSAPAHEFSETYLAVPGAAREARLAVSQFAADAGAARETVEAVLLSVSEAVTNSIVHAYPGAASTGAVAVSGQVADGELVVTIADDGCGWGGASGERGLGFGLALIARHAASVDVLDRPHAGAELRIHFALKPTAATGAGQPSGDVAQSDLAPVT